MIIWIKKQYKFYKIFLFVGLFIISIVFCFIGWGIIDSPLSCNASNIFNHATNQNLKVEIRADGTTMVNNKPFFPFGFYHVSWTTTAKQQIGRAVQQECRD